MDDVATTHQPYEYAGDDPVNLKDPTGKDCAGGPTTPTALANFIAAYEAGVFDQYELGVEFDDAAAFDQYEAGVEANESNHRPSPTSAQSTAGPYENGPNGGPLTTLFHDVGQTVKYGFDKFNTLVDTIDGAIFSWGDQLKWESDLADSLYEAGYSDIGWAGQEAEKIIETITITAVFVGS